MATIQSRLNSMFLSTAGYYRPLFRSGSIKPLWHLMIATSVIMYSQNYIFNKGTHVQARRKDEKLALAEYYEKHGGPAHH